MAMRKTLWAIRPAFKMNHVHVLRNVNMCQPVFRVRGDVESDQHGMVSFDVALHHRGHAV